MSKRDTLSKMSINDMVKSIEESEREEESGMTKLLLDESWCVEHYTYFYKDEGCPTCEYEDTNE
jgi:hypothetical protein